MLSLTIKILSFISLILSSASLYAMSGTPNTLEDVILYPITLNDKNFSVQGHRGAKGLYGPGNTNGDLQVAIDAGVKSFEIDVQVTSDNVVVLGHDDDISLTCSWAGLEEYSSKYISNMTYAEQQLWDCERASGLQPYPTLSQLLAIYSQHDLLTNIEIKPNSSSKGLMIAQQVMDYNVGCGGCLDNKIRFSSFHWPVLKEINELGNSSLKFDIGALTAVHTAFHVMDAANFAAVYSPSKSLLTQAAINNAKDRGLKVIPYTVNDKEEWDKFIGYGIDGMITDYPNQLAVHVQSKELDQSLPIGTDLNLIANPSFEYDLGTNWIEITGDWNSVTDLSTYEGSRSLSLAGYQGELTQEINLSQFKQAMAHGQYFVFRSYLGGSADQARLIAEYLDDTGEVLAKFDSFNISANGKWQRIQDIRKAPQNTSAVKIRVLLEDQNGDGQTSAVLDHFSFSAINP